MKKSFTKQLISLILAVCFTLAFPALSFAADSNQSDGEAKSESIYNEFKKSDGELICVSKYGGTDKFPENSAEAVAAAAEDKPPGRQPQGRGPPRPTPSACQPRVVVMGLLATMLDISR